MTCASIIVCLCAYIYLLYVCVQVQIQYWNLLQIDNQIFAVRMNDEAWLSLFTANQRSSDLCGW